jgi:hypothetical protein
MMHTSYHEQIPSFGVLTNGRSYRVSDADCGHSMRRLDFWFPFFQFYKYTVKEGVKQLVESKTLTLELTRGVTFQTCIDAATPLVSLLVHILKLQKTSFDSNALGNQ